MRLGILTYHRSYNCGAMLQAWALQTVIERMGQSILFPDFYVVAPERRFNRFYSSYRGMRRWVSWLHHVFIEALTLGCVDRKRLLHNRFIKHHLHLCACDPLSLEGCCDGVVVGSDQVWNATLLSEIGKKCFWGEGLSAKVPYISYAASVGDSPLDIISQGRLANAVGKFKALSVREEMAGRGLYDCKGRPPVVVADPSFLLSREDYSAIESNKRMYRGKYVLVYTMAVGDLVLKCAEKAGKLMNLPVVILAMYQHGLYRCPKNVRIAFGPSEWLAWIRDAEAIISLSFHGTAFAIIYGKPFASIKERDKDTPSRQENLLRSIGETRRLIASSNDMNKLVTLLTDPVYPETYSRINEIRKQSLEWLRQAIKELQ